jgi:hypothetical protein
MKNPRPVSRRGLQNSFDDDDMSSDLPDVSNLFASSVRCAGNDDNRIAVRLKKPAPGFPARAFETLATLVICQ